MKTVRLMIVDDDDQIREGMMYGIQWENLGIDSVESCRNGKEARDRLEQETFDLVITDISMPVLSGVELMRAVREKNPDIHFILISGYKEFEYAQAGIRYGAEGYILKPVHLDELIETVTKVCRRIDQQREDSRNRDVQRIEERKRMMKQIIFQKITEEKEIRYFLREFCGFRKIHALIGVLICMDRGSSWSDDEIYMQIFLEKQTEYLAGYTYISSDIEGEAQFLLVDVEDSTMRIFHVQQQIRRMLADMNRKTDTGSFSAAVSEAAYPKNISYLYECCKKTLEFCWFQGEKACLFYRDYAGRERDSFDREDWSEKIIRQIKERGREELEKLLEKCKGVLEHCSKETVRKFFFQNTVHVIRSFQKLELDQTIQDRLLETDYYADAIRLWSGFLYDVQEQYDKESECGPEIRRALAYIRTHYMEKITAEDMAGYLDISYGHFSRLFKQQTGKSFVKYLTQYRMDKAEELLRDTNLKVYEVAERVGIPDYIYFAQVFRNVKGVAPTEAGKKL